MNRHLRLITTITLPLLFTVGCASTDSKPFVTADSETDNTLTVSQEKIDVNASVKLAIHNMDGYLNQLEQEQPLATTPTEEITDMTVLIVEEGVEFDTLTNRLSATESEEIDQLIEVENSTSAEPEQMKFFFGFNKVAISDTDKAMLEQHGTYLLNNKNVVLVINGHADNRGNKNYNQYLSLLRAEAIAAELTRAGVPEGQLRIGGMGDNVPMLNASHWGENRRVELLYRDALMLSSQ
ncbi:MAG: OmpA family protein [Gammaproteobacteria bacterium]|nr:OmpA family protein [Gammaproteobacteria bacterium]